MDGSWERAIKSCDIESVRRLLRAGVDVNARDKYGQTALMLAAHQGHSLIVEELVNAGANLNATAKYNLTALMLAVVAGHVSVARFLAQAGTDLKIKGSGAPGFAGKTAYDLAVAADMNELYAELQPGK